MPQFDMRTAPSSRTRRSGLRIHWVPLVVLGLVLTSGAAVIGLFWLLWRLLG